MRNETEVRQVRQSHRGVSNQVTALILIATTLLGGVFAYKVLTGWTKTTTMNAEVQIQRIHATKLAGRRVLVSAKVKNTGSVRLGHTRVTIGTGKDKITLNIGTLNPGQAKSATANKKGDLAAGETYTAAVEAKPTSLMKGLVAWYRFDSGEGSTVHDRSGNGNDGTLYGDPTWVDGWIGDGALKFDGSGDYVAIQNLHYDTPGEISETTIFSQIRSSSSQEQIIAAFDRSEYWRLALMDDVNPYVGWDTHSPSHHHDLGSSSNYADGEPHTVVGWFKSSASPDKKIFADGKEVAQATAHNGEGLGSGATRYGFIGVGSEASSFNGRTGPNCWFKGVIEEVRIYNRALSPREIEMLAGGGGVVARTTEVTVSPG
ncbi:hypothetical protein AKJ37_00830 [candidate division MSBL1 archaeon SCGC-AAA259I09]|uniref:CARDB domain-containing protein n=1 Tax=candidate division MSBL1 archaeon SCGC-AAA259I09 TaxID=1698267 RepID=A0A133UVN1_9EURY|nr:hypothetical protein AKJ37_00830 [candidate division MSBL1 archaeon SCGC-AAA259I09]